MSAHDPTNERCRANIALRCPVGIECRHGYDHCPECDACTCPGAAPCRAWYSDAEVAKAVRSREVADEHLAYANQRVRECEPLKNPAWLQAAQRAQASATASLMDAMAQYRRVHPTILHRSKLR